jgi:hypothetical protein
VLTGHKSKVESLKSKCDVIRLNYTTRVPRNGMWETQRSLTFDLRPSTFDPLFLQLSIQTDK